MNDKMYYIWKKGENFKLSKHFNSSEFECKCKHDSCVEQRISVQLVNDLDAIRDEVGSPCIITSAFRCSKHQEDIRNSGVSTVVAKKSTHELGDAVDAKFPKGYDQVSFEKVCSKYFESIGLAKTFLHLDRRKGFRRWKY